MTASLFITTTLESAIVTAVYEAGLFTKPAGVRFRSIYVNDEIWQPGWFEASVSWDYTDSLDGWIPSSINATTYATYVELDSTSDNPVWYGPSGLSIDGQNNNIIQLRIKRTAGNHWDGVWYYGTSGHGSHGSYIQTIEEPGSEYQVITLDMANLEAGGDDWITNIITSLRVDFGADVNDIFELDYIKIGNIIY